MRRCLLTGSALLALAAACGLPEDDRPREITADRIPFDIDPADDDAETSGPRTVVLYLVDAEGLLTTVERQVPEESLDEVLDALIAGPNQEESDQLLTSNVPQDTELLSASLEGGIATIDLCCSEGGINSVQGRVQLIAYAQLVLTAVALDGVDQVQFHIEGAEVEVPNGDGAPTSEPVDESDYASLDPPPLPTTTTRPRPVTTRDQERS